MRRILIVFTAVASLLGTSAAPASGGGVVCQDQVLEQPFLRFLDPMHYVLVPGGDFESGAAGWTLGGGAALVSGSETFQVRGPGSSSLLIPPGGSATSPSLCVSLVHPTIRFFTQREGGSLLSTLKVEMLYTGLLGQPASLELLPGAGGASHWLPTLPLVHLGSALPALSLDGLTAEVRFRFTPRSGYGLIRSASFRIDDVYVDPYKLK